MAKTESLPKPAGTPTVRATTLARDAQSDFELQQAHTLLRHSLIERELAHHPDKAFTLQPVTALKHRVDIGYKGPVGPNDARNLPSALQHLQIIDAELAKECVGDVCATVMIQMRCCMDVSSAVLNVTSRND